MYGVVGSYYVGIVGKAGEAGGGKESGGEIGGATSGQVMRILEFSIGHDY